MKNILLVASLLLCVAAMSQSNKDVGISKSFLKSLSFSSINQVGIMEGEKGTSLQLQTINGFGQKHWFAGIGAGLDYYHLRTVPVFLDIRRNFFKRDKSPFVYADAGISFPWEKQDGDEVWYKEEYKNGHFYDLGLGYNLPVSKLGAFVFSIGYSEKKLTEERYNNQYLIYSGIYDGTSNKNEYNYNLRRISIKAGWKF